MNLINSKNTKKQMKNQLKLIKMTEKKIALLFFGAYVAFLLFWLIV
jgi:hypothetical protein